MAAFLHVAANSTDARRLTYGRHTPLPHNAGIDLGTTNSCVAIAEVRCSACERAWPAAQAVTSGYGSWFCRQR
jgi:hypothetical protein